MFSEKGVLKSAEPRVICRGKQNKEGYEVGGRTLPCSVLALLLEKAPYEILKEVMKHATATDRAMLFRVSRACRAAVQESGLPRAGQSWACPLPLKRFTGSVEMLQWARESGCKWNGRTCAYAARVRFRPRQKKRLLTAVYVHPSIYIKELHS